jgi:hypothetical protein
MTATTAPAIELPALPMMCGRAGDAATGDMNRDWECTRAVRIYTLHTSATQITDSLARFARLRSDYRRRNLARWITDAAARHARLVVMILEDLPECSHREETRRECTVEGSLPECTC